jgi:hypothetical protein
MKGTLAVIALLGFLMLACLEDRKFPPVIIDKPVNPQEDFTLVVNEVVSTGTPDWIEFYNYGNKAVQIKSNEVFISDDVMNTEKFIVDTNLVVAPKGFAVLECLETGASPSDGISLFTDKFRLSASGEGVYLKYLKNNQKVWADSLAFQAMTANVSFARIPDGGNTFQISSNPTKGLPNKP